MSHPVERRESGAWQETYRSDVLSRRRLSTHRRKLRQLGLLQAPSTASILDVCCGEGEMLDLLAESGFTNMTGLDIASDREGNLLKNGKSWRYLAASATRFPLREASFDWVLCAHSLHHLWPVENIESFLSEARRCLKPGGTLSLIDHYDSIQMRFALQVLLSPLACLTEWTRLFRQQHLEEKEQLYGYLNQWKAVDRLIRQAGFSEVIFKRDLFFFYCTAVK